MLIKVEISGKLMFVLVDEFYKVAAKAGGKYGKSPIEDLNSDIENPREYWYGVVQRIHAIIDQIIFQQHKYGKVTMLDFGDKDYDFEEFIKAELAAMSNRLAKDAWEQYGPTTRREILEKGPYVIAQMRDQLVDARQPRLIPDEVMADATH